MRSSLLVLCLNVIGAATLTPDPKAEPRAGMLHGAVAAVSSGVVVRTARTIPEKPGHVAGVITAVASTSFEILAGPSVRERMRVRFDRRTTFVGGDSGDLEPGRGADIVGVGLTNGDFLAARVMIHEGGCAVRTPDGAIVYHARASSGNDAKPVVPSPCDSGVASL